jgi:transcriptional regulator with XRE-family HTH domain
MSSVNLSDRLRAARKHARLTQAQLGEELGQSKQSVSGYETGRTEPSREKLQQIAELTEVNKSWLFTGEGDMTAPKSVADGGREYEVGPDAIELKVFRDIRPSAGNGKVTYEVEELNPDTLVQSKRLFRDLLGFYPPKDMRGIYIDGDSMATTEGPYEDGQLVLYRPVEQLQGGERYLLLVEDVSTGDWRLLFKRVQVYAGGGIKIISDNKAAGLEDETLLPNDEGQLVHQTTGVPVHMRTVGRVLWPDPNQAADEVTVITRTIERLVNMGMISS